MRKKGHRHIVAGDTKLISTGKVLIVWVLLFVCWAGAAWCGTVPAAPVRLEWSELPPLPNPHGVAGPFVGVSSDAFLVAGGANFPDGPPWEGCAKVWHDTIFVLTDPGGTWQAAGRLPRPLAYGVSVTWNQGVVCLGGGDRERHHADAFVLRWTGTRLETTPLPALPRPCAFGAGVLVDDTVYVAGGQETPASDSGLRQFW